MLDHCAQARLCRSCQTVLAAITKGLLASLAPMLPHLAEDAWQNLPQSFTGGHASVFQAGWQSPHAAWQGISEEHVATAGSLKLIRDHVNAVSLSAFHDFKTRCTLTRHLSQPRKRQCRTCTVGCISFVSYCATPTETRLHGLKRAECCACKAEKLQCVALNPQRGASEADMI